MAESAIPGLDAYDPAMERMARRMRVPPPSAGTMYGTPQGVALDPGAAEAARRTSSMRFQQPLPPEAKFAGPRQPLPESRPWTATDGTARPPEQAPVGERVRGAGAATGQGIKTAGQKAGEVLKSAGRGAVQDVLKGGMRSTGILSGISETAGHGNAYFDDNVPLGDKMRIGATDLVSTAGTTLGAVGGGLFGAGAGSVVPVGGTIVGGVAGGVAGGTAGHKVGRSVGNFLFGGDDALERNGYDPKRGIVDVAKSAINGEDSSQMFGRGNAAAGNGRGFVNPPLINPDAAQHPSAALPQPNVTVPPNPAGTIRRVGNSYSADGPIAFGADIDNPRNPGAGVTVLPAGPSMRSGFELPRSVTTGDGGSTLGQGPIGFGDPQAAERERHNRDVTFRSALSDIRNSNMKPRDKRAAAALAQEQYMGTQRMENERATASMRESGDMARANLSAGVQRENNAATTNATMRGQDMNYQGQVLSVRQAQAAAQRAQANTDREYMRAKGNDEFTQGQQAIKDLHQEIGGMIPPTTDRDGKTTPDTENAARYATAMQSMVGRLGGSMKDVTASDKARFVAGMQLSDVANATATGGLTPWGTRAVQSNEPILALRKLPNGDYQTNRKGINGETEVIPGRYIEKEGSTLGFGGRASNKFKPLME